MSVGARAARPVRGHSQNRNDRFRGSARDLWPRTGALHCSRRRGYDLYARDPGNLARLVTALADFKPYLRGAPAGLPFKWDPSTLSRGLNFTLITAVGDIDLLGEIPGGRDAWLQLLRAKRASGRPKDPEVIAELESIRDVSADSYNFT